MNEELHNHYTQTLEHVNQVRGNLWALIKELDDRGRVHDASKFKEPERSIFAANSHKLSKTEYGTPEYEALLKELHVAIEHHYFKNTHHPEHWENGIEDMDLLDVVEMLCDWVAAVKRTKDGDIYKSIEHNEKRFNINPQLAKILKNTVGYFRE